MIEKQRYQELFNGLQHEGSLVYVGQLLKQAAQKWPNKLAVICEDQKISYKELSIKSSNLAEKLKREHPGIKTSDRVVLIYENSVEFYIAYFAIWHIGAIVVPLNIFLLEAEILKIITECEPSLIVISQKFLTKFNAVEQLNIPLILQNDIENLSPLQSTTHREPITKSANDTAAILYTSGTTGMPKGVMLNSENIIVNAMQAASRFEITSKDVMFCPLPLFHSLPQNTCIWFNLVSGITAIVIAKIDRNSIIQALEHNPTVIMSIPAIYGLFCKIRTLKFTKIRYFFSGGDILSDKIRKYFGLIYKRKICNGYGLTETSPFISVDIDDYLKPTTNVGAPFIGIECAIRDSSMKDLKQGDTGVIWIKGKNVMQGYFKDPTSTAQVIVNGWFNTGDVGFIDDSGKIVITSREKDIIKSKGMQIFPQEIENMLLTNNKITQAAVIAISDSEGEYPVAIVESQEHDHEALISALFVLLKQNLAEYKMPKKIIIKTQLPLTGTGKIDKKKIKLEISELLTNKT